MKESWSQKAIDGNYNRIYLLNKTEKVKTNFFIIIITMKKLAFQLHVISCQITFSSIRQIKAIKHIFCR